MRFLFINPQRNLWHPDSQYISPPIGLISLATFIRALGYEVKIIDAPIEDFDNRVKQPNGVYKCGLSDEDIYKRIVDFQPDIVGISCIFTGRFSNVVSISKLVKKYKDIPVIVGGMHATVCAEQVLSNPSIDYAIMGEAELPLGKFLINGDLRGISTRDRITTERLFVEDLGMLPIPDYELIDLELYFQKSYGRDALTSEKRYASIVTSRGCPLLCSFCSSKDFWGHKWRGRPVESVLAEIKILYKEYGIKEISFEDDNLTANYKRAEGIFNGIIDSGIKIKWNTPNGVAVHNIDDKLIKLMKRSGCTRLHFGIESGNEDILHDSMNKNVSLDKVKEVIRLSNNNGLVTDGYFVLGMPGETKETIKDSFNFATSLALDEIAVNIAIPYPGTQVEKTARVNGWLKRDVRDIIAEDEAGGIVFMETPEMPEKVLLEERRKFFKRFYINRILRNPWRYIKRAINKPDMIRRFLFE